MKTRSPPCSSDGACQKWLKPISYSVAADWKLAMWPPSSDDSLLALQHRGDRVPAHEATYAVLELGVAGYRRLELDRDRVDVGGAQVLGRVQAAQARVGEDLLEQLPGALGAVVADDGLEGLAPTRRSRSDRCRDGAI